MRITEISMTLTRTINLGNFQNMRIEAGAVAHIEDGDQLEIVREALREECLASLREQFEVLKPKKKEEAEAA